MPEELKNNEVAAAEGEKSRDVGVEGKPAKTKIEQAQEAKQATFQKAEQARAAIATLSQLKMEIPAEQAASFDAIFAAEKQAEENLERLNGELAEAGAENETLESGVVVETPAEVPEVRSDKAVEAAPDAVRHAEADLADFERQNADVFKEIAEIDPDTVAQQQVDGKIDEKAWDEKLDRIYKLQNEYDKKISALEKAKIEKAVTEYSPDPNDQLRKSIDRWGVQVVDRIITNAEKEGDPNVVALPDDLQWKNDIILHGKDGETYVSSVMEAAVKDRYRSPDRDRVMAELSAQLDESLKKRERLLSEIKTAPGAGKAFDTMKVLQEKIQKTKEEVSTAKDKGIKGKLSEIDYLVRKKKGIRGAGLS